MASSCSFHILPHHPSSSSSSLLLSPHPLSLHLPMASSSTTSSSSSLSSSSYYYYNYYYSLRLHKTSFCTISTSPSHCLPLFSSRRRLPAATAGPPPPVPKPPNPSEEVDAGSNNSNSPGMLLTLVRISDGLRIIFAVLFWISLFYWASIWDDRDDIGPNKGSWFRR